MAPSLSPAGSFVRVQLAKRILEGTFLPRPSDHDSEHITLKLVSGYNIGIKKEQIKSIDVLEKKKNQPANVSSLKKKNLKKIAIVSAGGTIVSKVDYKTGGVVASADPKHIIQYSQKITQSYSVDQVVTVCEKDSTDVGPQDWKELAKEVHAQLIRDEIVGVLVFSGTDTLHYLSSALSFMIKHCNKPVIVTYSQRSTDRASTDGIGNLDACAQWLDEQIPGVVVIGHQTSNDTSYQILRGAQIRKMHTSRRDAFRPINTKPLGVIENGELTVFEKKTCDKQPMLANQFEQKIAFIHVMPGMDSSVLKWYMKEGYTGAIISFFGLGQIPGPDAEKEWINTIAEASKHGMIICAVAQAIYGHLQPDVYALGRLAQKSGVIYLKGMTAETAYVKLGCALGRWGSKTQVEQYMLTNISGELEDFESFTTFLS